MFVIKQKANVYILKQNTIELFACMFLFPLSKLETAYQITIVFWLTGQGNQWDWAMRSPIASKPMISAERFLTHAGCRQWESSMQGARYAIQTENNAV